ncbi:MAG: ParA family protein [Mucilaginibacter sp.]|uniref:ParA family protein n=1 Tax=Mucilaginibacter sp. TaxID=1882438 RepID=UPI0031AD430F
MITLFGNQKGGVGKSTLAVLFANYLSLVQNKEVVLFDMDNQRSIYNKFQAAQVLENKPLYEVEIAEMEQFETINSIVRERPNLITLLDVAGNIENDNLMPIFKGVDLIICPFAYDEFSVGATIDFAEVVRTLNEEAIIIFIPNRIKTNVKYETLESVNKVLANYGAVTKPIPERIDFQRITTFETPASIIQAVSPVFDLIYNGFINQKLGLWAKV